MKKHWFTLACLLLLLAGTIGLYFWLFVDMTGVPYSEIQAYQQAYPYKRISYSVTIDGGAAPLIITEKDNAITLETPAQADSLLEQAAYLPQLAVIDCNTLTFPAEKVLALQNTFPNTTFHLKGVTFLNQTFDYHTTEIDLSNLTSEQIDEAILGLNVLPDVKTVELCKDDGVSAVSLDDASALCTAHPDLLYNYRIELFGKTLSTDMERVEYFRTSIKDEGLESFRKLLPLMHNLTYFKLDWCGTSDEAMAQLRDEYADRVKVVWRVFFSNYNCLTDTLKIWANWSINDSNNESLKYCTDVKYLDLGHTTLSHCEWVRNMPDLEVLILADCKLTSIEPLRDCPKITFLEIFSSFVTDLSPLEDLKELQYLNISNLLVEDITPLYELDNMIKLNATLTRKIPQEQIDKYRELQPQCTATFLRGGNPTSYGWRTGEMGRYVPRYALLRKQFGYSDGDYSRYPHGYVTEEITYESTGITPPEKLDYEAQQP